MDIDHHLATYGTLAPGQPNHHQLSGLRGEWLVGTVRGNLIAEGWGTSLGYPALVLTDNGPKLDVHLFISPDLPSHWSRLDDFEGDEYRRGRVHVDTMHGSIEAWIYLAADPHA